jgi:DNA-binding protein HU-beta
MRNIQPARPMPASAKKPAKAKAETITLRHLAMALAENHDLKKSMTNAMLADLVAGIAKHLKKGIRVKLNGLGILQVRKRPARMGRNPATGEAIKIKASKKIAFRASKELKQAI